MIEEALQKVERRRLAIRAMSKSTPQRRNIRLPRNNDS
jgi:hypothetical protein